MGGKKEEGPGGAFRANECRQKLSIVLNRFTLSSHSWPPSQPSSSPKSWGPLPGLRPCRMKVGTMCQYVGLKRWHSTPGYYSVFYVLQATSTSQSTQGRLLLHKTFTYREVGIVVEYIGSGRGNAYPSYVLLRKEAENEQRYRPSSHSACCFSES